MGTNCFPRPSSSFLGGDSAVPATAHQFAADSNRVTWRDGATSVIIIAASDDGTHITAQRTTTC